MLSYTQHLQKKIRIEIRPIYGIGVTTIQGKILFTSDNDSTFHKNTVKAKPCTAYEAVVYNVEKLLYNNTF